MALTRSLPSLKLLLQLTSSSTAALYTPIIPRTHVMNIPACHLHNYSHLDAFYAAIYHDCVKNPSTILITHAAG